MADPNHDERLGPPVLLGPILYAEDGPPDRWRFHLGLLLDARQEATAVAITSNEPGIRIDGPFLAGDLRELAGAAFWRWSFDVARESQERWIGYEITLPGTDPVRRDDVAIPALGDLPRFAFFSCNGSSDPPGRLGSDPFALWPQLMGCHRRARTAPTRDQPGGFHLLVGGGDQVYADSLWYSAPVLKPLLDRSMRERARASLPDGGADALVRAFVELYCTRWSEPGFASVLARIPGVFTWDDHDIVDGWGSYEAEIQDSPVFQALFRAARTAFLTFQLGGLDRPGAAGDFHFQARSYSGTDRALDFLVLDVRSERTRERVMSNAQWDALKDALATHEQRQGPRRHLIVVSTVPLVHVRYGLAERAAGLWPGDQELEDDLIDQWESPRHRGERDRLVMTLLEHAARANCKVTVLSGDVHVAARGRILSSRPDHRVTGSEVATIEQVTSSPMVHTPPSWLEWLGIRAVAAEGPTHLEAGVSAELLPISADLEFLRERNWLAGRVDSPPNVPGAYERARLWLRWMTMKGAVEPQVVLEPPPQAQRAVAKPPEAAKRAAKNERRIRSR